MAADIDVDKADWAVFERHVEDLGMLMIALASQRRTWLRFPEREGSLCESAALCCGPAQPWISALVMTSPLIDSWRFFLHEHPAQGSSWCLWMIREILERPGVVRTVGDHCPFRVWCTDAEGPALVRKPTGWMTNSTKVANALDRRYSGGHRHCNLFSANAHKMRVIECYPVRLVNRVLRASR